MRALHQSINETTPQEQQPQSVAKMTQALLCMLQAAALWRDALEGKGRQQASAAVLACLLVLMLCAGS